MLWTGVLAASASLFAVLTARWLGTADRGVVVVFLTTSSFLMLIGSLGMGTGGRVLVNQDPPLGIDTYLRHSRNLSIAHLVTSATLGLGVLALSGGLPEIWAGALFVAYAALLLWCYLMRELLHGCGHHRMAVVSDVVPAVVQTALVGLIYATGNLTLRITMIVLVVGVACQTVFLLVQVHRLPREEVTADWGLRGVLDFSLPAMFASLGQAFVIRGDRLILGALAGSSAVGVYGAAATLTEILWIVPGAVAQVAFRRASISSSVTDGRRVRRLTLVLTAALGLALVGIAPWAIDLLLGPAYASAKPLIAVLVLASIPMASYQLDAGVLNGLGRLKQVSTATVASSAVLIVLCLALVPRWGAMGAAWGSVVAYTLLAAACKIHLRRIHRSWVVAEATEAGVPTARGE
ncbi:lipopolysaccharide biosynthesis protein [Knoellia flava]|uniref:lipopolysaccharide biosynthesis protein n=1 Tax=Knoellia flava TaxID=913969 RepID=UPI00166AA60B|nr:polysaccharide biosynthesis C-terminal domain-containing protein [Knoellia flava]